MDLEGKMRPNINFFARWVLVAALCLVLLGVFTASLSAETHAIIEWYGKKITWPDDSRWKVISSLNDPDDGLTVQRLDFVGDATNPGGYYYNDGTYIYFRVRVDADKITAGEFTDTVFVLIDNTGDSRPDYAFTWDTKQLIDNHGLELSVPGTISTIWSASRMDDRDGSSGQKIAPPDFAPYNTVPNDTSDGYVRTVDEQSTTNFGNTTFIDFAAKWFFLQTNTLLDKNQTWRVAFASINNANDHNTINYDVSGGANPSSSIDSGWSVPVNSSPTLATLGAFTAKYARGQVRLHWQTLAEVDVLGFNVWRAQCAKGNFQTRNGALIPAKQSGQLAGAAYRFNDADAAAGKRFCYQLEIVRANGDSLWSEIVRVRVP